MAHVALFHRRAEPAWVVRDRYTHSMLITGTKRQCLAYVAAFGLCYAEEA